jgi:small subunit ribosomal protein S6
MALYELVYIVRPDVSNQQAEQSAEKFANVARDQNGKVIKTEYWGLKTLTYRINKHRKGHYVMLGLEGSGAMITELERQMRLSDDIIRFMSIRVEKMTKEPSVQMQMRNRDRFATERGGMRDDDMGTAELPA